MAAAAHLRRLREHLSGPVTLGELSKKLGREGIGLFAFFCALPFLQPIPLAGLGTPIGILLVAIGLQLARGHETASMPRFAADRRIEAATANRLLGAAEKALGFMERFTHPRWPAVVESPRLVGAAIVVLGCIMFVPVFVPFGNPLTAAPLALLGLALLEDDGLLCAIGLAGTLATMTYHAAFAEIAWKLLHRAAARIP